VGAPLEDRVYIPPPLFPSVPGYEVVGELGRGGMGVVYKARHRRLNRVVALKMVLSGGHASAEERVRFLAEAEVIAAVKHPGIVQVFDFGTHDGLPFFSLEFCEGGSLAGKLAESPLPAREAAGLLEHVARAVQAAHDKGIVHRDLKPANVLLAAGQALQPGGRRVRHSGLTYIPKVTDFGLAKRVDSGAGMTATGSVMGTPSYMAPEQAQGKKEVGPSADVYSLGAILYDCLTGRPPFKAATVYDTLRQVVSDEPVSPRQLNPRVPADLETITLKCLQKDSGTRYGSAADLADDLGRWLAGEPILTRPAGGVEQAVKWARRRPALATLLGVSVLAVLGLSVLSVVAVRQWRSAVTALAGEREARANEAQERTRRALAQVDALLTAEPRAVPVLLEELQGRQGEVPARLRQVWDEPATSRTRPRRMRAALALLPVEPGLVRDDLMKWMLEVPDPAELIVVRNALQPHVVGRHGDLWRQLESPNVKADRRLRLLAALAAFDPKGAGWKKVDEKALEPWLADNPLYFGAWTEALRPAHEALLGPLSKVFRGRRPERRAAAASILADYAKDRPAVLADLVMEADDRQFAMLLPVLRPHRDTVVPLLAGAVDRQAEPGATEADREALAQRQSGAGLALARLGQVERVYPLLKHSPYPEARTRLILRLGPNGVDAATLVAWLGQKMDVSTRRALILALGEYSDEQVPAELRPRLVAKLRGWYRDDPDAGIHGAIDWLLRHGKEGCAGRPLDWGQAVAIKKIDEELAGRTRGERAAAMAGRVGALANGGVPLLAASPAAWRLEPARPGRGWYVNSQGQTLTVVAARKPFLMGSPPDEAGRDGDSETPHWRQIGRRYAIGTKPVTVAQFQQFLKANPAVRHSYTKQYSPEADGPIIMVTWYEAAQYCRWLSEQEGLSEHEMVYPSVAEVEKCKDGVTPLRLPADHLRRRGYRLPTEAEWENACRAGALTSRFYGSSPDLLPRYAWYLDNSEDRAWSVGQKRPNDLGLFDMHGNVWTWCQETAWPYPPGSPARPARDEEDNRDISDSLSRVLRGASYSYRPSVVRAALRSHRRPGNRYTSVGVRVARTLP
jgi:formylglycine-generating enzyme required for sulfatase activity/tRNA A-37 threonylcarbamoyl transferase component Bud32